MNGKRKLIMFLVQFIVVGLLCGFGKMSGAEVVQLELLAIPAFLAANYGEHKVKASSGGGAA